MESSACTGLIHESFWMDSTALYTRPWFAWANGFFAEFVIKIMTSQPQLVLGERRLEPEIGLVA